jgi:hypothetical protein
MSVVVSERDDHHELMCKGALEEVLGVCTQVREGEHDVAPTPERLADIKTTTAALNEQGLRVVTVAVMLTGVYFVMSGLNQYFKMQALPPVFCVYLLGILMAYVGLTQSMKTFYVGAMAGSAPLRRKGKRPSRAFLSDLIGAPKGAAQPDQAITCWQRQQPAQPWLQQPSS